MAKPFKYEKSLPVGKTDTYTLSPNDEWQGDALIDSFAVEVSGLTVNSQQHDGTTMQVNVTATESARNSIHWSFALDDGRTECITGYIDSPRC